MRKRAPGLAAITCAAAVVLLSVSGCADVLPAGGQDGGSGADGDGGVGSDGGGEEEEVRCVDKSGTRLQQVVLDHGGDEADRLRLIDTELGGAECRFRIAADGTLRCLPVQSSTAEFAGAIRVWTDPSCANEIGEVSYEGTPASLVVFDFPNYQPCATLDTSTRYHQAGSRLPYDGDETIYERDPSGACVARTAYFNRSYYTLGEEIPAARFVFGLETHSPGGRLGIRSIAGEDGSRACDGATLRDHQRDEVCTIGRAEDGALHCLPYATFSGSLYADETCSTEPISAVAQMTECAASNQRYLLGPTASCGQGRALFERGELMPGQFFYLAGACTAVEAGYDVFRVGAHVPPAEFAAVAEERRAVGGRLRRIDLVGGGVRSNKDLWFDPELDSACWFRPSGDDGAWRCVPVSRPGRPIANRSSVRSGFSDPACTAAVTAVAEDCSGVAPGYVVDISDGQRVYPVGARLDGFYQSAGTCVAAEGTWYQTAAALPVDALVQAAETPR